MAIPKIVLNKPIFTKLWEANPFISKTIVDIGIFLKYKTLKLAKIPNKITLPSQNVIYINNAENRGRALLISDGITQSRVSDFWKNAVETYKPSLVIDVGVNYGECIFSARYEKDTKIIGIEANTYLLDYIEQSRQQHVNREQIKIVHAFAGEETKKDQDFYVDTHWSGTSSGVKISEKNNIEKIQIPAITVDSLIQEEDIQNQQLLFKIDVEGFEYMVLKGMLKVLKHSKKALGIVEFDSRYLEKAGVDLNSYLEFLTHHFVVHYYNQDGHVKQLTTTSLSSMQNDFKTQHVHTDLILSSINSATVNIVELVS